LNRLRKTQDTPVEDGQILGLGTGRAAAAFVRALAALVQQGLHVRGVPTSDATAQLATELGIPLLTLKEAGRLDITFDGADEVDERLEVIKGYGGALVREKVVAASSTKLAILIGEEKLVSELGARGKLPVELIEFALPSASDAFGSSAALASCAGIKRAIPTSRTTAIRSSTARSVPLPTRSGSNARSSTFPAFSARASSSAWPTRW
jgi:ribose 5-phosphate isomerase